ncbi:hypothetical protein MD484_g1434, partial [Candolleomyces efflorescens]
MSIPSGATSNAAPFTSSNNLCPLIAQAVDLVVPITVVRHRWQVYLQTTALPNTHRDSQIAGSCV